MAMFHTREDKNGVKIDSNAHPSSEYEPRPLKPYHNHYMQNSAGGLYPDDKPATVEHETGDEVLRQIGSRTGTMTFASVLREKR